MSVEIRIRLTANDDEPVVNISLVEIDDKDTTATQVCEQSLREFCAEKHPQLLHLFDPDREDLLLVKLKQLYSDYFSPEDLARLLQAQGESSVELARELRQRMPPEVVSQVLEILRLYSIQDALDGSPMELMNDFLKEIEIRVQPLYAAAMNTLSAQHLRSEQAKTDATGG